MFFSSSKEISAKDFNCSTIVCDVTRARSSKVAAIQAKLTFFFVGELSIY